MGKSWQNRPIWGTARPQYPAIGGEVFEFRRMTPGAHTTCPMRRRYGSTLPKAPFGPAPLSHSWSVPGFTPTKRSKRRVLVLPARGSISVRNLYTLLVKIARCMPSYCDLTG